MEVEQLEHEPVALQDAGAAGRGLAYHVTAPTPKLILLFSPDFKKQIIFAKVYIVEKDACLCGPLIRVGGAED